MTHRNVSLEKYWKLFSATLRMLLVVMKVQTIKDKPKDDLFPVF